MGCALRIAEMLPEWSAGDSAKTERVRTLKERLARFEGVLQRKITDIDSKRYEYEEAARRHMREGRRGLALIKVQSMDQCSLDIARYANRHQAICKYVSLMDRVLVSDEFLSQLNEVRSVFTEASGNLSKKEMDEGDRVQDVTFDLQNILQDLDSKVCEIVKSPGNREDFEAIGCEDEERLDSFARDMKMKHGDVFAAEEPASAASEALRERSSSETALSRERQSVADSIVAAAGSSDAAAKTSSRNARKAAANLLVGN